MQQIVTHTIFRGNTLDKVHRNDSSSQTRRSVTGSPSLTLQHLAKASQQAGERRSEESRGESPTLRLYQIAVADYSIATIL